MYLKFLTLVLLAVTICDLGVSALAVVTTPPSYDVTQRPILISHKTKKSSEVRDLMYLNAKYDHAASELQNGNYERSLSLIDSYLTESLEILGEENIDRLMAMDLKGVCLRHLGRLNEALEIQNKVINSLRNVLSDGEPSLLNVMNNKAVTLTLLGNYQEALEIMDNVIQYREVNTHPVMQFNNEHTTNNENYLEYLSDLHNKAYILGKLGRYIECIDLFSEVIEKRKEILGDNNLITLRSMQYKAEYLQKIGEKDKALGLFQQVLEKRREVLGDEHEDTKHTAECVASLRADLNLV